MAKILLIDEKNYLDGRIPLRKGDDWRLRAQVVDRIGSADTLVDLTGSAASAFFPADDASDADGLVMASVTLESGPAGGINISLDAEDTVDVAESRDGTSIYVVVAKDGLEYTAELYAADVKVMARGFSS